MKKIYLVMAIIAMIGMLTGCAKNDSASSKIKTQPQTTQSQIIKEIPSSQVPKESKKQNAEIKIKYKEIQAQAKASEELENAVEVTFQNPQSMQDMKFVMINDDIIVQYKELKFTINQDSMSGNAITELALTTINSVLAEQGIQISMEGKALIVKGKIETGEFYLSIDRKTGNFLKLSIPQSDFEMEYKNFSILN